MNVQNFSNNNNFQINPFEEIKKLQKDLESKSQELEMTQKRLKDTENHLSSYQKEIQKQQKIMMTSIKKFVYFFITISNTV